MAREAVDVLLAFLIYGHQRSVAKLLEMKAECHSLFVDCLPTCGDFGIQV